MGTPLALAGLALVTMGLEMAAPATPAVPSCQGQAATIVQTEGVVEGTDGDDVIVGGSATRIRAHAGDDTICVAGGRVSGGEGRDSVRMRGTDGNEVLWLSEAEVVDVRARAGADHVRLTAYGDLRLSGNLDGGDGADVVTVLSEGTITINLAEGRLALRPRQLAAVSGFEDVAAESSSVGSRLVGDAGDNRLTLESHYDCGGVVKGGAGDDVISAGRTDVHETCLGIRAYGQAGNDVLRGSRFFDDILIGGPGRDRAYGLGDEGNDRCRAEIRRGCESRQA